MHNSLTYISGGVCRRWSHVVKMLKQYIPSFLECEATVLEIRNLNEDRPAETQRKICIMEILGKPSLFLTKCFAIAGKLYTGISKTCGPSGPFYCPINVIGVTERYSKTVEGNCLSLQQFSFSCKRDVESKSSVPVHWFWLEYNFLHNNSYDAMF